MDNNLPYEERTKGRMSFVGGDVDILSAAASAAAIRLFASVGIVPTRGVTITSMLKGATMATGKKYPRSQRGYEQAATDLDALANQWAHEPRLPRSRFYKENA